MKVHIGNYVNYIGPYQIAEKIIFWKDRNDDLVFKLGEFLAHGFNAKKTDKLFDSTRKETWLSLFCSWIHSKKKRKIKVKIDRWDYWSADSTLAAIILPLLIEFRKNLNGVPCIDFDDLPIELSYTVPNDWDSQLSFDFGDFEKQCELGWEFKKKQWDWILGEMIWSFEQLQPDHDWEEQYYTGEVDMRDIPTYNESGEVEFYEIVDGPENTFSIDREGMISHRERIQRGLNYFAKYYSNLWT
jgi:hypothetical protein